MACILGCAAAELNDAPHATWQDALLYDALPLEIPRLPPSDGPIVVCAIRTRGNASMRPTCSAIYHDCCRQRLHSNECPMRDPRHVQGNCCGSSCEVTLPPSSYAHFIVPSAACICTCCTCFLALRRCGSNTTSGLLIIQDCWQQMQQQQLVALSHSSASTHSSMLTWRSCQVVLKVCCRHLSFSFDSDGAHADVSALRHG